MIEASRTRIIGERERKSARKTREKRREKKQIETKPRREKRNLLLSKDARGANEEKDAGNQKTCAREG